MRQREMLRAGELFVPGEEGCVTGPVPLCHLNHRRFLVPEAGLYKAQTAAGFSTLRHGIGLIGRDVRVSCRHQLASRGDPLSWVTDRLSPSTRCCLVC